MQRISLVRTNLPILALDHHIPSFATTEDFEGTEKLLREEIKEGWQKPKGEFE